MTAVSSQNDTSISGDVTGGNKTTVNVSPPTLDAIAVHLAEAAAQTGKISVMLRQCVDLITDHNARLEAHIDNSDEFNAIVLELFEEVFAAIDGVSNQIDISARMAELQMLVDGSKKPRRTRRRPSNAG